TLALAETLRSWAPAQGGPRDTSSPGVEHSEVQANGPPSSPRTDRHFACACDPPNRTMLWLLCCLTRIGQVRVTRQPCRAWLCRPAHRCACSLASRSALHGEEPPLPGHAAEVVDAPIREAQAGAGHQVLDRGRHDHLAG